MRTIKEININSSEEEIYKFCEDVPMMGLGSEMRQMYLHYATSLLALRQQKKLLDDQNEFNKGTLSTNKNLVMATWVLVIVGIVTTILNYASTERGNLLVEYQSLPQFDAQLESRNSNTASSSVDLIIKTSDGGCAGFNNEVLTFAETIVTQNSITKHYLIPIDGYFSVHIPTGSCSVKLTDHATTTNGMGGIYILLANPTKLDLIDCQVG